MDASDGNTAGPTERPEDAPERPPRVDVDRFGPVDDEETLREAVRAVLNEAAGNDVDVAGRWVVADTDGPRWTVEVTDRDAQESSGTVDVPTGADVVETVATVVAAREGCSPTDLPPLYDAVAPDLLDSVGTPLGPGRVTFEYAGYQISVDADGSVHLFE